LNLPEEVLNMLSQNKITAGHARALLSLRSKEEMIRVAEFVVKNDLSVRALEALVKKATAKEPVKSLKRTRDTFFDEVEISLKKNLGRKVRVSSRKDNKGVLEIEFFSNDDLATIAKLLGQEQK
jgi:ParB family chromosome partitioning protein